MKELSPLAEELVRVGRGAADPTEADEIRVLAALQQRIGGPLQPDGARPSPDAPTPPPVTATKPLAYQLLGLAVGGGLVVGALVWSLGGDSSDAVAPPPSTDVPLEATRVQNEPPRVLPASPAPPAREPETSPTSPPVATPGRSRLPRSGEDPRAAGSLAEEVAIISRATSALHAGRPEQALEALTEHQRKFPRGALSQERRAARAQALCRLGRKNEALRELGGLPPSSPQAARVRQACRIDGARDE